MMIIRGDGSLEVEGGRTERREREGGSREMGSGSREGGGRKGMGSGSREGGLPLLFCCSSTAVWIY